MTPTTFCGQPAAAPRSRGFQDPPWGSSPAMPSEFPAVQTGRIFHPRKCVPTTAPGMQGTGRVILWIPPRARFHPSRRAIKRTDLPASPPKRQESVPAGVQVQLFRQSPGNFQQVVALSHAMIRQHKHGGYLCHHYTQCDGLLKHTEDAGMISRILRLFLLISRISAGFPQCGWLPQKLPALHPSQPWWCKAAVKCG